VQKGFIYFEKQEYFCEPFFGNRDRARTLGPKRCSFYEKEGGHIKEKYFPKVTSKSFHQNVCPITGMQLLCSATKVIGQKKRDRQRQKIAGFN
jgi:hypothetical protein